MVVGTGCLAGEDDDGAGLGRRQGRRPSSLFVQRAISHADAVQGHGPREWWRRDPGPVDEVPDRPPQADRRRQSTSRTGTTRWHGATPSRRATTTTSPRPCCPTSPTTTRRFNDETYFGAGQALLRGHHPDLPARRDGRAALRRSSSIPTTSPRKARSLDAMTAVKNAFEIPSAKLAFVATGPQQTSATHRRQLTALGFETITIDQVLGTLEYLAAQPRRGVGLPPHLPDELDDLTPLDIAVFDELPLDLAVVAGVITQRLSGRKLAREPEVQGARHAEHGAARRRPDERQARAVREQAGPPRRQADGFVIEATHRRDRPAEAQRAHEQAVDRRVDSSPRRRPVSLRRDVPDATPATALQSQTKFGSQGREPRLPRSTRPCSDASPTRARRAHASATTSSPARLRRSRCRATATSSTRRRTPTLRTKIDALIAAEKTGTLSPAQRKHAGRPRSSTEFYKAQMPPAMLAAITRQGRARRCPGVEKFKFRSSANAEDIPNFDGAGLHDSFSASSTNADNADWLVRGRSPSTMASTTKLEMKPKTLQLRAQGRVGEPVEQARHRGALVRAPRSRDRRHGHRGRRRPTTTTPTSPRTRCSSRASSATRASTATASRRRSAITSSRTPIPARTRRT